MIISMTCRLTLAFVSMRFNEFGFSAKRVATLSVWLRASLRFTHMLFRCGHTVALKDVPENALHSMTPSSTYHIPMAYSKLLHKPDS